MEFIQSLDSTTLIVITAAGLIIGFTLFAKFIKGILKIVIITVMLVCILYFLRQAGLI